MEYFLETYGCQMNIAESEALAIQCKKHGWEESKNAEGADLILLNTCSVRETAEQRVRGRLAHYSALKKKTKTPFVLVLAGCMASRNGEELKKEFPALDYTMGTDSKTDFPQILSAIEEGKIFSPKEEKAAFAFADYHYDNSSGKKNPFCSFVPIMHGCNNFCSYCIVPFVRGREVSREPRSILNEINFLNEKGIREITLLGQNVNSYNWENKIDFPRLLEIIAEEISKTKIKRIRFLSSHPKDFSAKLVKVMAENSCICRHLHLPLQHGSNRILKAMNRVYTKENYLELVMQLKASMPDISLSTDILVGFPGETEKDLEETLDLMEEVKFLYAFTYHYNPREGTKAFLLPDRISETEKRKRLSRVIALQKQHTHFHLKNRIGQKAEVLIEGISRKNADEFITRTERDEMAVVPAKNDFLGAVGHFAELRLDFLKGNTFRSADYKLLD